MKKTTMLGLLAMVLVFATTPVWGTIYSYTPPIDSIVDHAYLSTASEAAEKGFLANFLGITITELEALYGFTKTDFVNTIDFSGGYDPQFSWDYAIVKVDGPNDFSYIFRDDNGILPLLLVNGNDILTTPTANTDPYNMIDPTRNPTGPLGISHVSWFTTETTQVPEPTTLLLLGLGVVGLGGLARRIKKS